MWHFILWVLRYWPYYWDQVKESIVAFTVRRRVLCVAPVILGLFLGLPHEGHATHSEHTGWRMAEESVQSGAVPG